MIPDDLVFVGFNSRVLALHRETGEIVWHWKAPKPASSAFVTLHLDGDRLMVSANGYLYCLDPSNGDLLWNNETKGFGVGVASIVSYRGSSSQAPLAQAAQQQAQAAVSGSGVMMPPVSS